MKNFSIIIILMGMIYSNAQINNYQWNKISDEEKNFSQVKFEPDANGVILFEKGILNISHTDFSLNVKRRIKILKENGLELAQVKIPYYSYEGIESISQLKAKIYDPSNQVTELSKNDFTNLQRNRAWSDITFSLPNAKVGSIIEYEYTLNSKQIASIDAWYFQHNLPTLVSEFNFYTSQASSIQYVSILIGEYVNKKYAKRHPDNVWRIENVPSLESIKFMYNPKDQAEGIRLQAKGYLREKQGYYQGEPEYVSMMATWPSLIKEHLLSIETYKSSSVVKEISNQIANADSEEKTLQNVLTYFQKNFIWDNFYSIYPEKTFRKLMDDKSGNQADINFLLNEVLKNKGIKSTLTIFSPRQDARIFLTYPFIKQFKSMNNFVELKNGEAFLIDASRINLYKKNFAPIENYNHRFLLLNSSLDAPFITINQPISEVTIKEDITNQSSNKVITYNGYVNSDWIENVFSLENLSNKDEKKAEGNTRITTKNQTISNTSQLANPFKKLLSNYIFSNESRYQDVEFSFPFYLNYTVIVDKSNHQIKNDFKKELNSKIGLKYYQDASIKSDKIYLSYQLLIPKGIFESKDYKELKNFFDKLQNLVKEEYLID